MYIERDIYMYDHIYIYIYIHTYIHTPARGQMRTPGVKPRSQAWEACMMHPVSITRFPLRRFSPGAGLLRNRFCHR